MKAVKKGSKPRVQGDPKRKVQGQNTSRLFGSGSNAYVYVNNDLPYDAPEADFVNDPKTLKIYGNWGNYSTKVDGETFVNDATFEYVKDSKGNYRLVEKR